MITNELDDFYKICSELAKTIRLKQDELISILSHYETFETAHDEIERSIETLEGFPEEFAPINEPLQGLNVATFFPLNLPLYSLVLFAIAPSAFANHVFLRPPEVMYEILHQLWDYLEIQKLFPALSLKTVQRHIFVQLYASEADAIIFTGKYENALAIHKDCPNALLLYNGSGINPFLLFDNADVQLAAKKAVEMRCFNSGQDCAGPDAFFVPTKHADQFVEALTKEISTIQVGDTTDPKTTVGPTVKESYIAELTEWLSHEKEHLISGGEIDKQARLVQPAIIRKHLSKHSDESFHEFFAPFFYVLEYSDDEELKAIVLSPKFKERGMYISVFGDNPAVEDQLDFVKILKNTIVNDTERGNEEYGGYGDHANFLLFHQLKITQPVLLSRDLHAILKPQALALPA